MKPDSSSISMKKQRLDAWGRYNSNCFSFFYSKLDSTAKYLANPPCEDEPTDADKEDKEAELLVTRSQCVNNRLHKKSASASKNIFLLLKVESF